MKLKSKICKARAVLYCMQKLTPKFFANFLLIFLAVLAIFSFCLPVPKNHFLALLLYVFQGGTLGGLGGALADWYAVTALFRSPLGLPFPHTNIIAKNKDKIADNIAHFVVREFLNETEVLSIVQKLNLSKKIHQKFFQLLFSKESSSNLSHLFEGKDKSSFLAKKYFLEEVLFTQENAVLIAKLIKFNVQKHRHKIVSYVEQRVKEQGGSLIGWAVGSSIGRRVVEALEKELEKFNFNDFVFSEQFSQKRKDFLASFQQQGEKDHKAKGLFLAPSLKEKKLLSLETKMEEFVDLFHFEKVIDQYISETVMNYLPKLREDAFLFLQSVMQKWSGEDISTRLENAVGNDLAYIRVNGAIVGFLTSSFIEGLILSVKILLN
ncbi:DUF445 family protein [Acetobacteraceae bacterium]|nr:DUF445 family protein [Acetobacteraceae bacterium]